MEDVGGNGRFRWWRGEVTWPPDYQLFYFGSFLLTRHFSFNLFWERRKITVGSNRGEKDMFVPCAAIQQLLLPSYPPTALSIPPNPRELPPGSKYSSLDEVSALFHPSCFNLEYFSGLGGSLFWEPVGRCGSSRPGVSRAGRLKVWGSDAARQHFTCPTQRPFKPPPTPQP